MIDDEPKIMFGDCNINTTDYEGGEINDLFCSVCREKGISRPKKHVWYEDDDIRVACVCPSEQCAAQAVEWLRRARTERMEAVQSVLRRRETAECEWWKQSSS